MASATDNQQLHVAFFPFLDTSHLIPMLETARLFAARGVKITVITTPGNLPKVSRTLHDIVDTSCTIETFRFPGVDVGLPEGVETSDQLPNSTQETIMKYGMAVMRLAGPLEKFLETSRPHCLVADHLYRFASKTSSKFGIPRVVFHVCGLFSVCVSHAICQEWPQNGVSTNDELFVVPKLPHQIKLTKSQLPPEMQQDVDPLKQHREVVEESFRQSFGEFVNSFYELEHDYIDCYKKLVVGAGKTWHIGPLSLCSIKEKSKTTTIYRGNQASIDENQCLNWLDSKQPNSVVYVSFGSLCSLLDPQLYEIALALEASGLNFIWVVKNKDKNVEAKATIWLPDGFEKRMEGKGLIIRGWAPQVLILEHQAIGGFVTQCGWNSTLEGVTAGVPMVTWPLFSEQFFTEKFITDVLKIGVPVGSNHWSMQPEERPVLDSGDIEAALRKIMEGDEAFAMRSRVKRLKELAWKAVEENGSSHRNLNDFLQQLRSYHNIS